MTTIFLILILITGFSATQIVGEMMAIKKCPDERLLKDVVLGRKHRESRESLNVTKHLGICEKCRDKVDALMGNGL